MVLLCGKGTVLKIREKECLLCYLPIHSAAERSAEFLNAPSMGKKRLEAICQMTLQSQKSLYLIM